MFVRKETKQVKTMERKIVPYCKDCDSYNIETIRVCKDCGSHNVALPEGILDITGDDTRGIVPVFKTETHFIYTCDLCGKEFDESQSSSVICYDEGQFKHYMITDSSIFSLSKDICSDCLNKIIYRLNNDIKNITCKSYIEQIINDIKEDNKYE